MKDFKTILRGVLYPLYLKSDPLLEKIRQNWFEIVGVNLASVSMPMQIVRSCRDVVGGCLVVGLENSSNILDYLMTESIILDKMRTYKIKKLRYVHRDREGKADLVR